jgi:multiple sugar transport system permease protein
MTTPALERRAVVFRRARRLASRLALYGIAIVVAVVMLTPVVWMISGSLKTSGEVTSANPSLVPANLQWHNFSDVFQLVPFARYILNSFVISSTVTVAGLLFHSMAGYSLARLRYPGRNLIFLGMLSTMMVPVAVIIIPLFVVVRTLGWIDSYQGLIVPAIPHAFGIFLFRQFYLSVPHELQDAAVIDGAGVVAIYRHIMLPLSRPIVAALGIFFFLANWNNFLWPVIATQSDDMRVIQVGIQAFMGAHSSQYQLVMAASTIAAVPTLILFVVLQRWLVQGIKTTGLKG